MFRHLSICSAPADGTLAPCHENSPLAGVDEDLIVRLFWIIAGTRTAPDVIAARRPWIVAGGMIAFRNADTRFPTPHDRIP